MQIEICKNKKGIISRNTRGYPCVPEKQGRKGEIMAAIAAKKAVSYTKSNRVGLWRRFKEYLAENQQTITAGLGAMNGSSLYLQQSIRQGK